MERDFSLDLKREGLPTRLKRLAVVAEAAGIDAPDVYGKHVKLQKFEADVAGLLSKQRGLFFPTGTLAQRAALHAHHEEQQSSCRIVVHPTSHLVHHDCLRDGPAQAKRAKTEALGRLPNFSVEFVGDFNRALALGDFTSFPGGLKRGDIVVVELPQRMNGGSTMAWEDLQDLSMKVKGVGARLHMDGARIWEVQPHYGKELQEICSLFDSVYVSFYKGLGGMSGAMLCGRDAFIDKASLWLKRLGGSMWSTAPQWIDAECQLQALHGSFGARYEKLKSVVRCLSADPLVSQVLRFEPPIPQSCMVHGYVIIKTSAEDLDSAHEKAIQETGSRLWNTLRGHGYGVREGINESYFEWNMGPANVEISEDVFLEGWRAFARTICNHRAEHDCLQK